MKFNPVCRTLPALAMLAAVLAGCSQAPEIGISANQPGDLFAQAADAAFKGDLNYVKSCVESDARYLEAYDANGRSLLHYAVGRPRDRRPVPAWKRCLRQLRDNDGYYPLDAASGGLQEVMDLIREALAREAGRYWSFRNTASPTPDDAHQAVVVPTGARHGPLVCPPARLSPPPAAPAARLFLAPIPRPIRQGN